MSLDAALPILDGLLFVLLVLRLVALKRMLARYRPPSPLPSGPTLLTWEGLTVKRVS